MVQIVPIPKHAKIQVGDYVPRAGIYTNPGVVMEKKEDGSIVVDTSSEFIKQYHRHTNTSGLTLEEKEKFNGIMDQIMELESNSEKINQLQTEIDELKTSPTNRKIVETLRNQQAELIRMSKELPKVFNFDANHLR
jgi:Na+/phosphate symporter